MRRLGTAFAVGALGAIVSAILAFIVFPRTRMTSLWLYAGMPLTTVLGWLIPDWIILGLVPDGGPAAAMLLVLPSSFLVWTLLFGSLWYWRMRRSAPRPAS